MPCLHGLGVFLRNLAADDLPLENETGTGLLRFDLEPDVAVLAFTARLANELALLFDRLRDRFFVRDLRLADVGFDFELAAQTVENDLEMQLAHAGDDRLLRLFVGAHAESRIFLRESA